MFFCPGPFSPLRGPVTWVPEPLPAPCSDRRRCSFCSQPFSSLLLRLDAAFMPRGLHTVLLNPSIEWFIFRFLWLFSFKIYVFFFLNFDFSFEHFCISSHCKAVCLLLAAAAPAASLGLWPWPSPRLGHLAAAFSRFPAGTVQNLTASGLPVLWIVNLDV